MEVRKEYLSSSPQMTRKMGEIFAQSLKEGVVLCLSGDLGGGKTTFVQGLARGLEIKEKITSPSFVLLKKYKIPGQRLIKTFYHLDCYRLKNPAEILGIGYEEILEDRQAVVVIEWADKIKEYLPLNRVNIKFEFRDKNKRKIILGL